MANVTLPVSVVVPTHNSEGTVARALQSVLSQTQLPREIVVVDDCSSDSTIDVINQFLPHNQVDIRILQLDTNVGPSATRNAGWNSCTSEFVAFLDSDDSWHPRKLEIQTRWMIENPHQVISGHLTGSASEEGVWSEIRIRKFGLKHFLASNRVSTPTVIVRRNIPDRFSEDMWHAEDYDLWLRVIAMHGEFVRIELPLTQLHKADFGESGLSSHLYPMFRGEISAVQRLRRSGELSLAVARLAQVWMGLKYVLRVARTWIRRKQ
jgi:glycosyltransferase involved in cell wall biosynthesis